MIAKTGLLVLTNPGHIGKILPAVRDQVKNTLYIQLTNVLHDQFVRYRPDIFTTPPKYSITIQRIYAAAAALCQNLDVRVLLSGLKYSSLSCINTLKPIDVVIFDKLYEKSQVDNFLKNCVSNIKPTCSVITLGDFEALEEKELSGPYYNEYEHVVLGGTFDRLHIGHKILLNEAILRATKKVTVGVTKANMIKGKILWELIEPCDTRIEKVRDFLVDVCSELEYDIVPIQDPYGPTKSDPTMELIIISEETMGGAKRVNDIRGWNCVGQLNMIILSLVHLPDRTSEEEEKISSSTNRMRLLGTLLKDVYIPEDKKYPYVIGLTGGIASGKSSISARLEKLGAAVINCDHLAHEVYRAGRPCFNLIKEHFGDSVVGEDGQINRRALGDIVFHDKSQLEKLNSIVWPKIADELKSKIKILDDQGHKIIVIEAAVLVQANWHYMCHEIWACIISEEEAVKRLKNRNNLSEEEAKARLGLQPKNIDHIENAHVVFCTFWSENYTQATVELAWKLLHERIASNTSAVSDIVEENV